jgi:hypothetical protein
LHAISDHSLATIKINCITTLLCNHTHALWLALKLLVRVIFWQARGVIEQLNPPAETKGVIKGDNWIVHPGLLSAQSNIHLGHAESVIGHGIVAG